MLKNTQEKYDQAGIDYADIFVQWNVIRHFGQTHYKWIQGNTDKTALLKDTPKPLRVFFYPACHLPALTGGVIFYGEAYQPSIAERILYTM